MLGFVERLIASLEEEWRALSLSLRYMHVQTGVRATLATMLALLAALWLHLDNPWWAGISAFVIGRSHVTATLERSFDRAIGTLIGAVAGYLGAALVIQHLAFAITCAVVTAISIYGFERAKHGYAFLLGGVTAVVVMFGSINKPDAAIDFAVYRALEILVGIAAACLVDYVLAERAPKGDASGATPPAHPPGDRELAVNAISGGLAVAMIPTIWESLQLPALGQTPITAVIILISMQSEPHWKAITRASGCLIGGIYGLLAMKLAADALLPWLALMAAGLFVGAQVNHRGGEASYIGLQAGVALIMRWCRARALRPTCCPPSTASPVSSAASSSSASCSRCSRRSSAVCSTGIRLEISRDLIQTAFRKQVVHGNRWHDCHRIPEAQGLAGSSSVNAGACPCPIMPFLIFKTMPVIAPSKSVCTSSCASVRIRPSTTPMSISTWATATRPCAPIARRIINTAPTCMGRRPGLRAASTF